MNAPTQPGLTLIVCEGGYGRLTSSACVKRWKVANGLKSIRAQAEDDSNAQLRASRCNGCEHGRARAGVAPVAVVAPAPRFAARVTGRERPAPSTKPCAYAPCGKPFVPVRANHVYCGIECKVAEGSRKYRLAKCSDTRTRPCSGCGKAVQVVRGKERWCYDPCRPSKYAKVPIAIQQAAARRGGG
jgi:hypothetical protein